jgi:hypothetical protein
VHCSLNNNSCFVMHHASRLKCVCYVDPNYTQGLPHAYRTNTYVDPLQALEKQFESEVMLLHLSHGSHFFWHQSTLTGTCTLSKSDSCQFKINHTDPHTSGSVYLVDSPLSEFCQLSGHCSIHSGQTFCYRQKSSRKGRESSQRARLA